MVVSNSCSSKHQACDRRSRAVFGTMPKRVVIYTIRCPRGQECKKGGSMLKKSTDKTEVQDALYNHLTHSPYHTKLGKGDCLELLKMAELESWEEEWESEEEGPSRRPSRSRPLTQCVRSDCDICFKHPLFVLLETQPV